ncbi:MAG: hypothetical protein Q9162_002230 [Coniocarpon cinnabarinum]
MFTSSSRSHRDSHSHHSHARSPYSSSARPQHAPHSKSSPTLGSSAWVRPASTSHRSKSPSGYTTRSLGGGSSSYSYTRARPRSGFIQRMIRKIQRYLKELLRYIRRHPVKFILPIVMALASGGALQQFARRLGVPIPQAFMKLFGAGQSVRGGYDAWYGSQEGYGRRPEGQGGLARGVIKSLSMFL